MSAADTATLEQLLRRIARSGLPRIPKKQKDARILMALSLQPLDPEGIFDEADIDAHLRQWLAGLGGSQPVVDHVTWRRGLVDFGFLRRATDGAIYRIKDDCLNTVLALDAQGVDPLAIVAGARKVAQQRNHKFTSDADCSP